VSLSRLASRILSLVHRAERPYTVTELARSLPEADRGAVRRAVAELTAAGELAYTQRHGRSVVEPPVLLPRRVSARIVLLPEGIGPPPGLPPGARLVRLGTGAAFGAGDHPTTRLALRALDDLSRAGVVAAGARVLDIGTGTGVLAIAAVVCGAASALGIDIEPAARWEARRNAALNGMAHRIRVTGDAVEGLPGRFDLILANLRYPTLHRLLPEMARRLPAAGVVVLSGMRPEEVAGLVGAAERIGFGRCWFENAQGWAAVGLRRGGEDRDGPASRTGARI